MRSETRKKKKKITSHRWEAPLPYWQLNYLQANFFCLSHFTLLPHLKFLLITNSLHLFWLCRVFIQLTLSFNAFSYFFTLYHPPEHQSISFGFRTISTFRSRMWFELSPRNPYFHIQFLILFSPLSTTSGTLTIATLTSHMSLSFWVSPLPRHVLPG